MRTMNKLVVRGFIQWLDAANQEEIETDRVPAPWDPTEGQPLEQESFYF
jgi:hypothetical protein